MTAGGLSAVDIGDPRSVGGITREYFTKLAATVGVKLAWDEEFKSAGGGPATGGAYAIEPHRAEQLFADMAREAGVKIQFGARLTAVKKDGPRIIELMTEDGRTFRAKMFVDASYEGDLMAKAGVKYTLRREGNAQYGETLNGIHYSDKYRPRTNHQQPGPHGRVPGGQGVWDRDFPLDPYVVKGNPQSGLLPLVQEGEPGVQGDPAPGVQAYCFRLCLTTNPANTISITPPADYDANRYEIVVRFIDACRSIGDEPDLRWFSKHDPLPNNKWDFNTATFGGNLPGASWAWPEASYAERVKIAKEHENYHRGLLHFLASDRRVPEKVRREMQRFGLPKDEFTDNGGWPHQIYVREARRMVGNLVMTEHHTFGHQIAPKSIALGSYGTDIHEIRRIVKNGVVTREGKIATGRNGAPPYPIGYDAIVPQPSECENLFVPFAVSASHVAFASIRMEPVFMCLSQSAATAACLAIDEGVAVQGVEYEKLKPRLERDGQVLAWKHAILPGVDLSADTARQTIVAAGTAAAYQGHPTTLLLPDGKTMFCVWTLGHGGFCGPLRRSDDGGKTWSALLPVPESWRQVKNCPALYRLTDPAGVTRLFVFAGQGPDGAMHSAHSTDDGRTWTDMRSMGLKCVMPFCTIVPVDSGEKLIGLTNIRRPNETNDPKSNVVAQSESTDGGLTWTAWRVLVDLGDLKPCEPEVVRSPDGKQLLCLMRENVRSEPAHFIISDDEGRTWSAVKPLPPGLHGDRHKAVYAPDGRLVVCFRDMGLNSPTKNHFVAWVGRYEDILSERDGEYKTKLLNSYKGSDCGYPGLELLPDGTFVATTYVKYRPGPEQNSVVSVRFNLTETDRAKKAAGANAPAKNAGVLRETPSGTPLVEAQPQDVQGKSYDLVIIGGTPSGIACAVRAAREGLSVLLVQHNRHLGGMLTNGLMQWDALYGGPRAPIFNEFAERIDAHYRQAYGPDSKQYAVAHYSQTHYPMSRFEPSVAERLFNQLVSAEMNITVLLSHYPVQAVREGRLLKSLALRAYGTTNDIQVGGGSFVDATYEGDLAALANVPYRVGREGREEYGEPHAGKLFTNIRSESGPLDAKEGKLNLHLYGHKQGSLDPASPQTADAAVQAYNYRFCLSNQDGNRRLPEKPAGYNREEYVHYNRQNMRAGALNGKGTFNSAILPGENHAYPEADWPTREKIIERHKNFALGLMWFLQNDETVSVAARARFRTIGLPLDEYEDNDNLPYEMYVREARRIVGRYVFTEHDNRAAAGLARTPLHPDSVAFTDWAMDSHDCTTDRRTGFAFDGKLILTEESRPAQVPYRCLLPQGIDNLLVPVPLSASHVGWGAIRLEPVWMQTGECAGFAAALSKELQTTPGKLDSDLLVRRQAAKGCFVSFFNDLAANASHAAMPAAQYFATKGFFPTYDARLDEPLTEGVATAWKEGASRLRQRTLNPAELASKVQAAATQKSPRSASTRGEFLLALWRQLASP